jgi:hypothetical protein
MVDAAGILEDLAKDMLEAGLAKGREHKQCSTLRPICSSLHAPTAAAEQTPGPDTVDLETRESILAVGIGRVGSRRRRVLGDSWVRVGRPLGESGRVPRPVGAAADDDGA